MSTQAALKNIVNKTREAYTDVDTKKTFITPALAAELLKKNTRNRPLKKAHVSRLANMMERGQWRFNGDPIRISKTDKILDGQHRLHAIVESNQGQYAQVTTGLEDDVFTTIDVGRTRSHGDHLSLLGYENGPSIASAARIAMFFDQDGRFSMGMRAKVSPEDIVVYVDKHPGIVEAVNKYAVRAKKILPGPIAAGCYYVFSMIDEKAATEYLEAVIEGANLKDGSPALAVRNRFITMRGNNAAGSTHRLLVTKMLVHGFNYFRTGKELQIVKVQPNTDVVLNGFSESVLSNWG